MTGKPHGAVLYRATKHRYPVARTGQGMRITDTNGKRYLDMSGGAAVSVVGHGHPAIVDAVQKQIADLAFAHTSFFTNEPQEQLASMLVSRFGDPGAKAYFLSGGSEANETALKLAWQYWLASGKPCKKMIISREHSYHGNTLGGLSVSGNEARRRASAAPLLDWPRIPPCYPYREKRDGESMADYSTRAAAYLAQAIEEVGADNVAAFICEPIVGSSLGVVAATGRYLEHIRAICDRYDVLLIADEVMCGSGRTGTYFAHEADGIRPDIVTLAKGIGGGYQPLAAAIVNGRVAAVLHESGFAHGHTYIGHPTACAAGLAVQQVMSREKLLERSKKMGGRLLSLLHDRFDAHPNVGEIRGRGLFAAIELVQDRETKSGFKSRSALASDLQFNALDRGLICYPGSVLADGLTVPHIMLAPPLIVEDRHLLEGIDKLASTIDDTL